ncbi:MAG: heavy metal-associated domain-containing protein [Bacteroidales bacterium]
METLKLSIPKMKCMGCTSTIENHLSKVGGIVEVKTDIPSKSATITYNGGTSIKNLILNTLKGIGYPAEVID